MTSQPGATFGWLLILLALGSACGRTPLAFSSQHDGSPAKPTSDSVESPLSGVCGQVCPAGIACQGGTCQQYRCKGELSFNALAPTSTVGAQGSAPLYRPALGDFDGDGILDLIGVPETAAPMSILYGAGNGTFPVRQVIDAALVGYWQALAADVDGDGVLDLTSIGGAEAVGLNSAPSSVAVRRGSGDRTAPFAKPVAYPTSRVPSSVLLADLDADGQLDLLAGVGQAIEHWRGQPGGQFVQQAMLPSRDTSFAGLSTLLAADWNDDGLLDLVSGSGNLYLRMGRGDGDLDAELACALALDGGPIASTGILGDLDHDHRLDLVVHQSGILLGLDGCHAQKIVPVPDWPKQSLSGVALADVDGDENLDIVADADTGFTVRAGDGRGGFAAPLSLPATTSLWRSASLFLIGDVNRDRKLDIVFSRQDGWGVLLNTCR